MTIHRSERKESQFEVFSHALKLRREIRRLAQRNFGYKPKIRNYETEQQQEQRFKFESRELAKETDYLLDILREITANIIFANKIYPKTWAEYCERRLHQTKAIAECGRLSAELQYIIEDFGSDVNKFIPYDALIQKEISLLKAWRKSDNKSIPRLLDAPIK